MQDGVLNVNKPKNITSSDVVYKIKKKIYSLGYKKKVGHTGTLDPMATGVLPICIGEATKISQYISADKKRYLAETLFGVITDTLDVTGKILSKQEFVFNSKHKYNLIDKIRKFRGEYYQEPPMYSAIKYNGKRLYELARTGINIKREKRLIKIFDINIVNFLEPNKILLDIICSNGTYVRSLCDDIGKEIGCGACLSGLKRISCGKFLIDNSVDLDNVMELSKQDFEKKIINIEDSLINFKKTCIDKEMSKFLYNGNKINIKFCNLKENNLLENEIFFVYDFRKRLVGIYKYQDSFLMPLRLFSGLFSDKLGD